jgi:hypothetical protein
MASPGSPGGKRPIKRLRGYSGSFDMMGDDSDILADNPKAPCGSCAEWLKKVAESNPDLKVITFADTTCEEVFVRSIFD